MNYVSFSLYGNFLKYTRGAVENAKFIHTNLSGWNAIFYCGHDVSEKVINDLTKWGAIVCRQNEKWHENGMFWRFQAIWDLEFSYLIFRDTDSRITSREIKSLLEWQLSGKLAHIMRDHPYHRTKILGGMWGIHSDARKFLPGTEMMKAYGLGHGQDQFFLAEFIYPQIKKFAYVNDSFFAYEKNGHKFSEPRVNGEYIGESLEASGTFSLELRNILLEVENSQLRKLVLRLRSWLSR
jgi:hypothetical protein